MIMQMLESSVTIFRTYVFISGISPMVSYFNRRRGRRSSNPQVVRSSRTGRAMNYVKFVAAVNLAWCTAP